MDDEKERLTYWDIINLIREYLSDSGRELDNLIEEIREDIE